MIGENAELNIVLTLKDQASRNIGKVKTGFAGLQKTLQAHDKRISAYRKNMGEGIKRASLLAGGGIAFLAMNVKAGIDSLAELEEVNKRTEAVLKSTGRTAQFTVDDIRSLSEEYEALVKVDDKVIQAGANLLLTFTNINKRGFEPALETALDMSAALGTNLNASIKLVGKALNDPIKGLSALSRIGVTFTDREKKKIEQLVKTNRLMDAQAFILRKLNTRFGGQGAAAANTYRGAIADMNDAIEGLQQGLALALLPALTKIARKFAAFAKTKEAVSGIRKLGDAIGGLFSDQWVQGADQGSVRKIASPFTKGLEGIRKVFDTVKALPWDTIQQGMQTTFRIASQAMSLFNSLDPAIQGAVITALAVNKIGAGVPAMILRDLAGLALKSLTTIMAGNVTVVGTNVIGPGGGGGGTPGPQGGKPGPSGSNPLGTLAKFLPWLGVIAVTGEETKGMVDSARAKLEEIKASTSGTKTNTRGLDSHTAAILQQAQKTAALQPIQNDILNGIAKDAQATSTRTLQIPERINPRLTHVATIVRSSGERVTAEQRRTRGEVNQVSTSVKAGARQTTAAERATAAKTSMVGNAVLRTIPVLGGVRGAVNSVRSAVARKDLSVTVRTAFSVSAREVASEVQRVQTGRGFVTS